MSGSIVSTYRKAVFSALPFPRWRCDAPGLPSSETMMLRPSRARTGGWMNAGGPVVGIGGDDATDVVIGSEHVPEGSLQCTSLPRIGVVMHGACGRRRR